MRVDRACCSRWLLSVSLSFGLWHASEAAVPLNTPTEQLHVSDFDFPALPDWGADIGAWSAADGTYNNASALPRSVSTINTYLESPLNSAEFAVEPRDDFAFRARMLNASSSASTAVGLVFNFRDGANYDEIVFAPNRIARLRRVVAGVTTSLGETIYAEGGQGRWFDVELFRAANARSTVVVNGNVLFREVLQGNVPKGRLGVIAYNTLARFEDVSIEMAVGSQPFAENFDDGLAQGWPAIDTNHWSIVDGVLKNFTVQQTNRVQLPVVTGEYGAPFASVRARLLSPYGASGNLVGLSFGRGLELTFSRTGVAKINGVDWDGNAFTQVAAIPTLPKDWFEVVLDLGLYATVRLNDQIIFSDVQVANTGSSAPEGTVGLLTHWSPGRFDRVEFQHSPFPRPYVQGFSLPSTEIVALAGVWVLTDGVYTSIDGGPADLTMFASSPSRTFLPRASFDFSYKARLRLPTTGASGLVTHYSENGEYYEVLFTPAGEILVNKHVQGTTVRQATGTHSIVPDTWFDVEVRCVDNKTRIAVNGADRLSGILQGQLRDGRIGVITRNTVGQFDDIAWAEIK